MPGRHHGTVTGGRLVLLATEALQQVHAVRAESVQLDSWRWTDNASCLSANPDLFFADSQTDTTYLRGLCTACPVRADCLDSALANNEHGWWGGTTDAERKRLKRTLDRMNPGG